MIQQDMASMPIPDLIKAIRDHTKKLDSSNMVVIMVLNVLCNRLEEQEKIIEELKTILRNKEFKSS